MFRWVEMLREVRGTHKDRARLQEIEIHLAESTGVNAAPVHMRAGVLAAELGDPSRSLLHFGEAIDLLIEAGRFEAAAAACRTLLKTHPDAVRAIGTLIWLEIGAGRLYEAAPLIRRYAEASRSGQRPDLAKKQLEMLADLIADTSIRTALADALELVGAPARAALLRSDIEAERLGRLPRREMDCELVWQMLQRATLRERCGGEDATSIASALIVAPPEAEGMRAPALQLVS